MGNLSSRLQKEEIAEIQAETGFTSNQIERLYSRFTSLDKGDTGTLTRENFYFIPELALNPIRELILNSFFTNGEDQVNFRQFVRVLATFRPISESDDGELNTRESKLKFVFKMYDQDHDGYISKDELTSVLKTMVGSHLSDEQLSLLAERAILDGDTDEDGRISFEEFSNLLKNTDVEEKMSIDIPG